MNGSERERKVLSAAASQISAGFCLWCPTTRWKLRWAETGQRFQLVVVHRPRCRAVRSPVHRKRADEFVIALLLFHGALVGDYNEDDLVVHTRLVIR